MDFSRFSKNFSDFSAQITPFASRTFQFTKEQLGQADDRTQLPADYIDLEKKVDALKQAHQKMLAVTSQYTTEAYDYPPNIKETFQDLGRTVSEKVSLLSSATSTAEAQAALVAPASAKPQPKTFNHAISRASLSSSQLLHQHHTGAGEDPLATALEKYALAMERVGDARLAQDSQIQSRFLAGWNTTLNTNLTFATRARKNVENSRLTLDAVKARVKGTTFKLGGHSRTERPDEAELSSDAQEEIEKAEDEFVTQTEEAVGVMKNVLDTPEPLRNLAELVAAQMEYHKKAYEVLSELAPVLETLQTEQEQKSRLRDDDRKGHLDILLRATEQFLAQGDVAKAAKAFGIILQLRPRTQSIDIRLHNLWSIGAEILMRQREKLQTVEQQFAELSNHRNRTASASSNGIQMVASWWGSSSNMSEIKSYFEILIRQYAYDHKLPHKISAVDFWLALLSCELNHIYTEHLGGILRLEDEYRLQRTESAYQESPNPSDSISRHSGLDGADSKLQYEPSEHWIKKQMEENCQRTLTDLWDINQRMEKLMDQLPYSKNAQFLQLKEMMSLLSIELSSATADISAS
ncbi:bar domain [Trichoderma arundinaceum]|uniref:Bar domain n=1 Tax=Trichoderma arundinaceum TaxID=490622 RepID=A0A395NBV7_TRIAR|nr:bar domain [Trichoderma arundinaceum]